MSMFTSKRSEEESGMPAFEGRPGTTIIAQGVRVEGDFTSEGDVQIEGEVHGHVATNGMLSVGSQAKLTADVSAEQAVVAGSIDGNLTIGSHLDLKATAKIVGDVSCETASIEPGATLNGKVVIGRTAPAPKASSKSKHADAEIE